MARNNDRDRGPKRAVKDTRPRGKKKSLHLLPAANGAGSTTRTSTFSRRFMSDRGQDPLEAGNR